MNVVGRKICIKHIKTLSYYKKLRYTYSMNEQQMWTQVRIIDEKYCEKLCDRNTLSFSTLKI